MYRKGRLGNSVSSEVRIREEMACRLNSPADNELRRNEKVRNLMYKGEKNSASIPLGKKANKQNYASLGLWFAEDVSEDLQEWRLKHPRVSNYDLLVHYAVCTLWMQGKRSFSLNDIYGAMRGEPGVKAGGSQAKEIMDSLRKLSGARCTLKVPDKNGEDKIVSENLLCVRFTIHEKYIAECFGNEIPEGLSITILHQPIMLEFTLAYNCMQTVPMSVMAAGNLRLTEKTIGFKDYLLNRVLGYNSGNMHSNRILLSTIYKEECLDEPKTKQQSKKDREIISRIMDDYIKQGIIDSYNFVIQNGRYMAIDFTSSRKKTK